MKSINWQFLPIHPATKADDEVTLAVGFVDGLTRFELTRWTDKEGTVWVMVFDHSNTDRLEGYEDLIDSIQQAEKWLAEDEKSEQG